ncbi:hypothetical protein EDC01DRAFT_732640 [Geopyxis carbonaria]|nr:hypothetical protein EDC01DRAFT_732640 [Geopyxis carbonaria]
MAHPVIFWPKPFFYALGNTPAVDLTANLPLEEPARVLLLGCGDPRSILYTIWAARPNGSNELDITCCDFDVAVLARNVILLTLIRESIPIHQIWNIFYDLYLDEESLAVLVSHSKQLCQLSESIEEWNSGPYGSFIRICNLATLSSFNRQWKLYADVSKMSAPEKKRFKAKYTTEQKAKRPDWVKDAGNSTLLRNAGPLGKPASKDRSIARSYEDYWNTGITPKATSNKNIMLSPNPTFAYTMRGDNFDVHYGTNPLLGFHFAQEYVQTKERPNKTSETAYSTLRLTKAAQEQFEKWCKAFKIRLDASTESPTLVIRMFAGEVLAFCSTLNTFKSTGNPSDGRYVAPWKLSPLILDGGDYTEGASRPAPTEFNVIDTSNLEDHIGLVNILVCASPLLLRTPESSLYTELLVGAKSNPTSSFIKGLCGDVTLMALLFGLVPSSFISGFNTVSNIHEIWRAEGTQFHQRQAWKVTSSSSLAISVCDAVSDAKLTFGVGPLAKFLFEVYQKMFWTENFALLVEHTKKTGDVVETSILHYNRESFVRFLKVVQTATQDTDNFWKQTMEELLARIRTDRKLLLGMNCYQELLTHLYVQNVYPDAIREQNRGNDGASLLSGPLKDRKQHVQIVCVTLVIPKTALDILLRVHIGSPILICEIYVGGGHNIFSSFHPAFAKVEYDNLGNVMFVEDRAGRNGSSPLIASFWVPAAVLVAAPPDKIEFRLRVQSTPQTSKLVTMGLGLSMDLWSAKLPDSKRVLISNEFPDILRSECVFKPQTPSPPDMGSLTLSSCGSIHISSTMITLDASHTSIVTIGLRMDIVDPDLKVAHLDGAVVSTSQPSPCTITVSFASTKKTLLFPYPVDQSKVKVRIARKSSYIEVHAPPSDLLHTAAGLRCFPVVSDNPYPVVWNMHNVQLDILPSLEIAQSISYDWLKKHMMFTFSRREMIIRRSKVPPTDATSKIMCNVKDSLFLLFSCAAGIQVEAPSRVFGLANSKSGHFTTLIFVNSVRLDLAAHTVVVDCCVLLLTDKLLNKLRPFLNTLKDIRWIIVDDEDEVSWKYLLPAFTERCRTWSHLANCSYRTHGIPVSLQHGSSPLCGCAPGNPSVEFSAVKEWAPMSKYVTRAAIGLFYPLLEDSVTPFGEFCAGCDKPGKTLKCKRCMAVGYCGVECQKADWKRHKEHCVELAALRNQFD